MNRFTDIIGQKDTVAHLQNSLRDGHISHAYIFAGEKGSGKYQLALTFAAALQCEHPAEENSLIEPCGNCHSCHQAATGNQPDIITVTQDMLPEAERRKNSLGVKLGQWIVDDVIVKPYSSRFKIYLVPDAEKLTPQAQNALLKTLEEPPAYAVIILLAADLSVFLPTVLSRCVLLRLHPLSRADLIHYAEDVLDADSSQARLLAGLSHGNPGRAKILAEDPDFAAFCQEAVRNLEHLSDRNAWDIASYAESVQKKETDSFPASSTFLDLAYHWCRDILYVKSTGQTDDLTFPDAVQYMRDAAAKLSFPDLERIQEALLLAMKRRSVGGKDDKILEMLLLEIRNVYRSRK